MTRTSVGSHVLPDHVDAYRERIRPQVPLGFQRVSAEFHTSPDKRKLTFSFKDQQSPVPLMEWCTRMPMKHRIESNLFPRSAGGVSVGGFRINKGSISGTVFVAAGQP